MQAVNRNSGRGCHAAAPRPVAAWHVAVMRRRQAFVASRRWLGRAYVLDGAAGEAPVPVGERRAIPLAIGSSDGVLSELANAGRTQWDRIPSVPRFSGWQDTE